MSRMPSVHDEEASELLVVLLELHPSLWKRKHASESCSVPLQQVSVKYSEEGVNSG